VIQLSTPERAIRRILLQEASAASTDAPTTATLSYSRLSARFGPRLAIPR
jgi:hypothetical protein